MYEEIQPVVQNTICFDESSDLIITYLSRTDITRTSKVKAEKTILISDQWYAEGKLLDITECQILIYMGASLLFMSKIFYLRCKAIQALPNFTSKTQRI